MTMKNAEPTTRFTPGLNRKLTSRTSLVARAIVSPTGCRLWKVMLLPSRETYSSSRISRSTRLADQLRAEVAPELQHAAQDLRPADDQRQREQDAGIRDGLEHGIEGVADQHRHHRRQHGIADRTDKQDDHDQPVARGVRPDPAHRSGAVGGLLFLVREGELGGCCDGCHKVGKSL